MFTNRCFSPLKGWLLLGREKAKSLIGDTWIYSQEANEPRFLFLFKPNWHPSQTLFRHLPPSPSLVKRKKTSIFSESARASGFLDLVGEKWPNFLMFLSSISTWVQKSPWSLMIHIHIYRARVASTAAVDMRRNYLHQKQTTTRSSLKTQRFQMAHNTAHWYISSLIHQSTPFAAPFPLDAHGRTAEWGILTIAALYFLKWL